MTAVRLLIVLLLALVGFLQYRLWVGEGSLAEVHGLRQEIAAQEVELERLATRNRELQAEVDDLRTGVNALEERARGELGMIKPGEIFLQVIERPRAPAAP
jgi:cell division protein FtsB